MFATLRLYQQHQNGVLCMKGMYMQDTIRASTKVEKIFFGGKSVEFPLEPLRYYNFLPNDWSEFKLGRKTHGLRLNLTGLCCFKSQWCTSRGVYMLAMLRLYQRCQNGVLCMEGISLQLSSLGFEPMTYINIIIFCPMTGSSLNLT